jgi:hypothetical protein
MVGQRRVEHRFARARLRLSETIARLRSADSFSTSVNFSNTLLSATSIKSRKTDRQLCRHYARVGF